MSTKTVATKQATKSTTKKQSATTKKQSTVSAKPVTNLVSQAYQYQLGGQVVKGNITFRQREAWLKVAEAYAKDGLKPTAKGLSQDKIKSRIEKDLFEAGFVSEIGDKANRKHVNAIRTQVYRIWGIYGSGTTKNPFHFDKEKQRKAVATHAKRIKVTESNTDAILKAWALFAK